MNILVPLVSLKICQEHSIPETDKATMNIIPI